MTEETREPTSNPEPLDAVSDLPPQDVDAHKQSDVKGGALKANIPGNLEQLASPVVRNLAG